MTPFEILETIKNISSTNEKIYQLSKYKDNEELQYLLRIAFDPMIITGINKLEYVPGNKTSLTIEYFKAIIKTLISKNINNEIREQVKFFLNNCNEFDASYYYDILTKNLRIGMDVKNINAAFGKDFIKTFNVMLADKNTKKIKYPCQAELKLDGVRCLVLNDNDFCQAYSRNGKKIFLPNHINYIRDNLPLGAYDCEILLDSNRTETSGLCNRLIKKPENVDLNLIDQLTLYCFDYLTLEEWNKDVKSLAQSYRSSRLNDFKFDDKYITHVETTICENEKEVLEIYEQTRKNGNEGLILKNLTGLYEFKRSSNWIKMKAINRATLKCIGVVEGKNKYEGMIGNLICSTKDGLIVEVGSGLTDSDRVQNVECFKNKLIEIEYNEIQKDKNGNDFIFLPIYKYIREDKEVEDSLVEILKEMK